MKRLVLALAIVASASSALAAATTGVVFSSGGDPVAGARVTARRAETVAQRRTRVVAGTEPVALASATTADDGTFSLDAKVSGVIELFIDRADYAPIVARTLSGEHDVVVDLMPAPSRTGRVTAAEKPVAGAFVMARADQMIVWSTRTDERGAYTIADPRGWCSGLIVLHPDFASNAIEAQAGANLRLDVTLDAGRVVSGTVVGPNGRPAAKARVSAGMWQETIAGEDGTFTLRHVAAPIKTIAANDGSMFGAAPARDKDVIKLAAGRSISGTVRDADKRPLGGVIVAAYGSNGETPDANVAITDDKGSYEIPYCEASKYRLFAFATSDLTFEPRETTLVNARSARADLTATAITSLRGIVLDERKHPVAGATVQWVVAQMPILYGYLARNEVSSTLSGADGHFRLPLPTDDRRITSYEVRLQALRNGFAVGITEPLKIEKSKSVTITLPDGIAVSGTVTDSDGKSVRGAGIMLIQDPWGAAAMPIDSLLASGTVQPFLLSDAQGTFTLHLNRAPHDLGVWKEGLAGFRQAGFTPSGGAPLKIVLERGVEIRGRVTRKGATKAIEGTVLARGEDASFATAAVAKDGTFVLSALRAGSYTVVYDNDSGLDVQRVVTAPATDVVLELPAAGEVHGRVVDKATERPIANYDLSIQDADGNFRTSEIDANGAFVLQLQAGSSKIIVRAEGYIGETTAVDVEAGKTQEIEIAMTAGRTVTGRVLSDAGGPVSGASISVGEDTAMWQGSESDENGEFTISGLARERSTLRVQKNGFLKRSIDIEAGTGDTRVDIVLSRGKKATGKVITSAGAPVEGATVWVSSEDAQQAQTGADGTFVIEGLSADRYVFSASREDLGSAELTADLSQEIVITMKPAAGWGSVHGRVKGFLEGGWMYGGVTASATDASSVIGRDGTYRLTHIPAGEVELRATAMSMQSDASSSGVKVTIVPNDDIEADLAFQTDNVIRGTVTEGSGQPAPGRRVRFNSPASSASATTGEHGAYQLALEPGMYNVSVESNGPSFETRYQVTGAGTFDIHLDYAEIRGRVVDDTGAPLAGVTIEAAAVETQSSTPNAQTDAGGAFLLKTYRAPYVVTATKNGYAAVVQRVEPDAAPLRITMTESSGLRVRLVDARDGHTLDGYIVATDDAGMKLARLHDAQSDGSILVPLAAGGYRISASSNGYATQSVRASMPREDELRIALTPGGTLIVHADRASNGLVKLVHPNGEEYVRCECNGIAEIRLSGVTTTIEHVAPGTYAMQLLDEQGRIKTSYSVTIAEGQMSSAEIHVPE